MTSSTRHVLIALGAVLSVCACGCVDGAGPGDAQMLDTIEAPDKPAPADVCAAATQRLGHEICRTSVPDETVYELLSVPFPDWPDTVRSLKFTTPAVPGAALPTVFQRMDVVPGHLDFLHAAFPNLFGDLSTDGYLDLVLRRATRQYYTGTVAEVRTAKGTGWAIVVYVDSSSGDELLDQAEVGALYDALAAVFAPAPLMYAPAWPAEAARAKTWGKTPFPIFYGSWVGGG